MLLQLPLHFIFLLLLPLAFSSFIAKPGCHERCGSLLIPFPFGVGSNCSLEQSFNIICDNSTDPPKAYLFISNKTEVIEIKPLPGSLEQLHSNPRNYEASLSQIRVKYPYLLNSACYDTPGSSLNSSTDDLFYGVTMGDTQYTLSDRNWLTAIGCDDLVLGLGVGEKTFGGGCVSFCQNETDTGGVGVCPNNSNNGYSSGNGCCRTPIPAGADFLGAQLTDLSEKWGRKKQFSCSYAFVEEEVISNQSQNTSYPLSSNNSKEFIYDGRGWITSAPPVVRFDWRIGSDNCRQANRNTTYACQDNSECVDVDAMPTLEDTSAAARKDTRVILTYPQAA